MGWSKERQREYDRQRYQEKKDEIKARVKARSDRLRSQGIAEFMSEGAKEAARERSRAWYRANTERALAANREYRDTDRGRAVRRASAKLRQARKRGAPGTCTPSQLLARIEFFRGMCSYCRVAPFEHIDHAIPISRGGTNWPSNLRPACAQCNLTKWTKTWREFLAA